jgi:hypothetical protein
MRTRRDYSCEIMGIIVLTVLSALSHFWYILIAICVVTGLTVTVFLVSRIFLRVGKGLLIHVFFPAPRKGTDPEVNVSVDIARRSRPSLRSPSGLGNHETTCFKPGDSLARGCRPFTV